VGKSNAKTRIFPLQNVRSVFFRICRKAVTPVETEGKIRIPQIWPLYAIIVNAAVS